MKYLKLGSLVKIRDERTVSPWLRKYDGKYAYIIRTPKPEEASKPNGATAPECYQLRVVMPDCEDMPVVYFGRHSLEPV